MERKPIVSEYHQLREYLNRANKLSNEKTELKFEIEQFKLFEYRLYAISESQHETHRIALAERSRTKNWERTGFTNFIKLEEFCALELNKYETKDPDSRRNLIIPQKLILNMNQRITENFKNLLLGKYYEPR